jgi:hypothetical protein
MHAPDIEELFGPVVHVYTREEAVEDGVLVQVPYGHRDIVFTANLWADYDSEDKMPARRALITRGLTLLQQPDPEDLPGVRKLRDIVKDRVWVVEDYPDGPITFMRPEDY